MKKYLLLVFSICLTIISTEISAQNSVVVHAFLDQNGNGMDDEAANAAGLTTAELFLVESGSGTIYNHVEGAGAEYTFDDAGAGLPDGNYTLQYVETPWTPAAIMPANAVLAITLLNVGVFTADNDVEPVSGISAPFVLAGGAQNEMDIDIGLYPVAALGDFVWEDINGDGLQDGELANGIDGVTVTLLDGLGAPAVDTDNIPVAGVMTAGGGDYIFGNLPPGDYRVQFSLPTVAGNWFATTFNPGDFGNDSDADPTNSLLSPIYTINNSVIYNGSIDAGFIQAVSIGNQVWEDQNGDGVQDPGEPGINGVTISLFDDAGAPAIGANGLAVPDQVTANIAGVDGSYSFTDIAPGQYQVQFSLPAPIGGVAWYPTEFDPGDVEPDDSDLDSDASNNPADGVNYLRTTFITVLSAETDEELRIDAGFWLPAMIGDRVFCDENGNGINDDGAAGVDGVDVTLVDANTGFIAQDADGTNLVTQTAGGAGMYLFELVPPGDYFIQFAFTAATPDPPFVFTLQNDPDGLGDDFSDSDADPVPGGTLGQTEEFNVVSQDTEEEEKWDAGVYQVINIFGTIWLEDDMNNMYDGEMGPGGVFLEIFDGMGNKVDETFTNAGDYEFIGLAPGDYFIQFDVAGTALESATPCPGSNDAGDMVDNDDNGIDAPIVTTTTFTLLSNCDANTPPEVFYIDFCYFFDCNEPNLLAATACDGVLDPDIICDISILGTFCNLMPSTDSPGNQPNPLCSDGGAPHNISWFAFVAYGGDYSITVTPTGCSGSTTGVDGVQIGLYTDCTFTESVYCNPNCNLDAVTFDSAILEEGQTYYFFIDGCSSSVCSYEVEITGNPLPPNLLPQDVCIVDAVTGAPVCEDATYCPDAAVEFIATDFDLTVNFTWTVTTISGVPYTGDTNPTTEEEILSITFPDEGVYEICLIQVDNGCAAQQWNGNICRQVTIEGLDDEMFDEIIVCEVEDFTDLSLLINAAAANPMDPNGDGTIGWQGGTVFTEGTNMFTVTTPEGCMYEQEFELTLHPVSMVGVVDMTICKDELPLMIDIIPITELSFPGTLDFVLNGHTLGNEFDVNGCDSIIDIHIELLDLIGGAFEGVTCVPEGIIMTFNYLSGISTAEEFITFEWFDPTMTALPDTWEDTDPLNNIAPVSIGNGTYTFVATITKNGTTCTFTYPIEIDFDQFLPPNPEISAPGIEVCEADSIVTYTAINFGDAFGFNWSYPNDVASATTSGADDEIITINWSGSAGGQVTLITENACGMSEEIMIDITVIPQPTPVFTFTTEVCIDSCTIITYVGDASLVDDFDWDFDGGTENNGTGSEGAGPHCVSWSDAGDKTITLTYTDLAGCVSTITTEMVTVIPPLTPPTINCVSQTGVVTFSWDLIAGTTESDYSIVVETGQTGGVLSGTTYTLSGLTVNEQVNITMTILTNDACVEIVTLSSCVAQDCTPPIISISAPGDSIFCLNGTDQSFDFIADIPTGVTGTGVYSGSGIIDTLIGTFNPDSASVGINTITYIYNTDDGCTALASSQVVIFETPVASFTSDVDTICITDQFNLNYDGTAGAATYTWDYGTGGTGNGGPTPSVSFDSPGTKTIRLTVEKDDCVSESYSIDLFVQPELEDIVVTCSIQEIDQVQFSWNDIDGATGYLVEVQGGATFETTDNFYGETGLNPDDMVTITVTVLTDSKCPGSTFTQTCTAVSCSTFTFSYDNPITDICIDDDGSAPLISLQALASGGDGTGTYTWSGTNVTDDQFDPNGLGEGQFELFVIYEENSCQGNGSVIVNITLNPLAAFSVDMTTICVGETVTILYEGSQHTNQTITWTPASIVAGANPNEYLATFATDGTFDIILEVANGNCTTSTFMTTITVEPELVFGAITCIPALDQVTFTWDAVDCATQYDVFIGGVSQGLQTTTEFIVTGLDVGTEVDIEVFAMSDCACEDVSMTGMCETTDCTPVDLSLSTMGIGNVFCFATDLAPIEIIAETIGSLGNGTFVWSGPGVDQDGMFDPIAAGVGTHTIVFDFLESAGCPYSESITFTINELPEVTAQFDEIICYDQATTDLIVNPTGGTGVYDITLNTIAGDTLNDVPAGTYEIIVSDENQCTATTSVTITQPNEPTPTISGETDLILGDSSTYSIQSNLFDGTVVDSVVWTANGTEICNDAGCFSIGNQIPEETTIFDVTVYYNGTCSVTTSITVVVTEIEPVSIFLIPNIISPNGDGANDNWQFVTNNDSIIINSIKVFDRWGNNVWGFNGPVRARDQSPIWDGMYNGKVLLPGVYVYFVNFDDDRRQNRVRSGDITIIN